MVGLAHIGGVQYRGVQAVQGVRVRSSLAPDSLLGALVWTASPHIQPTFAQSSRNFTSRNISK